METEAYTAEDDPACHAFGRRTARTEIFWGEGGRAYIYLCYGLHWCLNVVAHEAGKGGVVLLRAVSLQRGLGLARRRRRSDGPAERLASGPARLTQAFGITGALNATDLRGGKLRIEPASRPGEPISAGTRIGITRAVSRRWRFWLKDHPAVSPPPRSAV